MRLILLAATAVLSLSACQPATDARVPTSAEAPASQDVHAFRVGALEAWALRDGVITLPISGDALPWTDHAAVVDALTAQRTELERGRAELFGAAEDARLELKRTEADVEVVDARIARDAERLRTSSSPKDVAALEQELAALGRRKSDLEDIELAVMETVEEREGVLAATDADLATLVSTIADATDTLSTSTPSLPVSRRVTSRMSPIIDCS